MQNAKEIAAEFFSRYADALLARDARAVATMYAVPSLILFPDNSIAVSDAAQTEDFFAASWEQYESVESVEKKIELMGETAQSIWADVTWIFDGEPKERFCYQLVAAGGGWQIAVLTLLME